MYEHGSRMKPIPDSLLRPVLDHQRWLKSAGRFGARLVLNDGAVLDDIDLRGFDFSRADFSGVRFRGGSVKGTRFADADLSDAIFEGCNVEGADFDGADLHRTVFVTNHTSANFGDSDLRVAAFSQQEAIAMRRELSARMNLAAEKLRAQTRATERLNLGPNR